MIRNSVADIKNEDLTLMLSEIPITNWKFPELKSNHEKDINDIILLRLAYAGFAQREKMNNTRWKQS